MGRIAFACAIAWVLAFQNPAAAQDDAAPLCIAGTPSFTPTEANRLSCQEFGKLRRSSAAIVLLRKHAQRPNCEMRITRPATARDDGSFVQFCEVRCPPRPGSPGFDWRPCGSGLRGGTEPRGGTEQRAGTGRTTGVAACQGGVWCGRALGLGRESEACGSYHREGDRYAYAWVRGRRTCFEGDITLVPR